MCCFSCVSVYEHTTGKLNCKETVYRCVYNSLQVHIIIKKKIEAEKKILSLPDLIICRNLYY